ncbi:MAG: hypothetical protein NT031_16580, partial [Planctomycetota bacterium]|nr:hypothetical protein [Planctomycetota bacterium]
MFRKRMGTRASKGNRQQSPRRRTRPLAKGSTPSVLLERCEDRLLLSVVLTNIPDWTEQGPRPITGAQVNVPPNNLATGAVESVAVNPNNLHQIYVGTVNGGIWRTDNADTATPDATAWVPLTDTLASLAIGDIAFSPLDPAGLTLYAGTGSFSNLSSSGGPAIGVLRTTDGGASWA